MFVGGGVLEQDFVCVDRFLSDQDAAAYGDLIQFPLMGQAIVMAYNVPSLSSLNASLVRPPPQDNL
jgi:ABC-type phosphate transport system substrate-binding protein